MFCPVLDAPSVDFFDLRERTQTLLEQREQRLRRKVCQPFTYLRNGVVSQEANGRNRPFTMQLPPGGFPPLVPDNDEEAAMDDGSVMEEDDVSQISGA